MTDIIIDFLKVGCVRGRQLLLAQMSRFFVATGEREHTMLTRYIAAGHLFVHPPQVGVLSKRLNISLRKLEDGLQRPSVNATTYLSPNLSPPTSKI